MTVYVQFGIFFLQLIFAAAGLLAGILLGREALRRRGQKHLALFSLFFGILGIGGLLWFLGGFFDSQGFLGVGQVLASLFVVFTIVGSFFFGLGLTYLYTQGVVRWVIDVTLFALAVLALIISDKSSTEALGVYFAVGGARSFLISYGYWLLTNVLGTVLTLRVCQRMRHKGLHLCAADRFVLVGSLLSIAGGLLATMFIKAELWGGSMLVYAVLTLAVVYKYFGANAKGHPNPDVAIDPYNTVRGSIMGKVLVVSAVFFAVLTFMLLSSTTNYFVSRSIAEQQVRTRITLADEAGEIEKQYSDLIHEASMLAGSGDIALFLAGQTPHATDLAALADTREDGRWIEIMDRYGNILATSLDENDRVTGYGESSLIEAALSGQAGSRMVWDDTVGTWVVRSAAPILGSDGAVRGAVVLSVPMLDWNLPNCIGGQMVTPSGCGLASSSGEIITASGLIPDGVNLNEFRSHINEATGQVQGETDDYFWYAAHAVRDTRGNPDGFVYSVLTRSDLESELFRVLSAIVVVISLFLAIALIMLAFGIAILLRPLRLLTLVAERVSRGDYGVSVDYESPDEMGRLAAAFNHMSATIRDRTRSLNERVREQRDFLSHTASEIRTPLNIFRWSLEMLRFGDTGQLNKEQMELIEQMNQTNERIRSMVDEMILVSSMDKGALKLDREPVVIEDVIDEVAGEFSVKMRERMIDFYWRRPEHPMPRVDADRKRISDVIANLIGNSVKFTGKEGHIFVTVSESDVSGPSMRRGHFVHIQVEDNGRGIPSDQRKFVFRRFFRARNVIGEEIEGTGLGLYISKILIEMHGGEIWFESEENSGSTFTFSLPAVDEGSK